MGTFLVMAIGVLVGLSRNDDKPSGTKLGLTHVNAESPDALKKDIAATEVATESEVETVAVDEVQALVVDDDEPQLPVEPAGQDLVRYLTVPFDPNVGTLPPHFKGHDPQKLYSTLTAILKKDEFESTKEYDARVKDRLSKHLFGDLTVASVFATPLATWQEQVPDNDNPWHSVEYDADRQVLEFEVRTRTVRIDTMREFRASADELRELYRPSLLGKVMRDYEGLYTGENAFGATSRVIKMTTEAYSLVSSKELLQSFGFAFDAFGSETSPHAYVPPSPYSGDAPLRIRVPMTAEKARTTAKDVRTVVVYRLTDPPVTASHFGHGKPTRTLAIDNDVTNNYINVDVIGIWVYNNETGDIYLKLDAKADKGDVIAAREPVDLKGMKAKPEASEDKAEDEAAEAPNAELTEADFVGRYNVISDRNSKVVQRYTLTRAMKATRSLHPDDPGTWELHGNEARITFASGGKDIIRKQGDGFIRITVRPGGDWEDPPLKTAEVRKTRSK